MVCVQQQTSQGLLSAEPVRDLPFTGEPVQARPSPEPVHGTVKSSQQGSQALDILLTVLQLTFHMQVIILTAQTKRVAVGVITALKNTGNARSVLGLVSQQCLWSTLLQLTVVSTTTAGE